MDRGARKSDIGTEIAIKPLIVARLAHRKGADHRIADCKQTTVGLLGKRPSTFEMKVSNYELDYEGRTTRLGSNRKAKSEWIVAVRSRRTGKVTLAPFDMVNFVAKLAVDEELINRITKLDPETRRRNLIMEFGTKKAKQALNANLRNHIDEKATDLFSANAMSYMQENIAAKKARLEENGAGEEAGSSNPAKVQSSSALPPFNAEAKTPGEIYDVKDIVDDGLLEILLPEAERFLQLSPKEAKEQGHPPLVLALIQMSSSMKNLDERKTRVAQCIYLSYLIRLNRVIGGRARFLEPSAVTSADSSMPQEIVTDLMNKFTSAGGGGGGDAELKVSHRSKTKLAISAFHRDTLLARIVVLLLILSGQYAFSVQKSLQDLGSSEGRVTAAKLLTIAKALGCRVERHQQSGGQICILDKPPRRTDPLLNRSGRGRR